MKKKSKLLQMRRFFMIVKSIFKRFYFIKLS